MPCGHDDQAVPLEPLVYYIIVIMIPQNSKARTYMPNCTWLPREWRIFPRVPAALIINGSIPEAEKKDC
jgi:hypothetical protein